MLSILPAANVNADTDGWQVEGEHGVLQVSGQLTEGACRLAMRSAMQQIELGNTDASPLRHPGDRGTPVAIRLYLRDCLTRSDLSSGKNTTTIQPTISIIFQGETDSDNSQLLAVKGASGMGLRLLDVNKNDLHIGTAGGPQSPTILTPDSSQLTYYVVPERTSGPLIAGAWRAVVDFKLNYD
ncbi:hypothetical protein BL250_16060 [Erwinia sp. OLTSP20]|nr:hypothetical protein BV501_16630 [Erwinia sp. OAMSP11]PIJ68293.1 hypothetical protein BK416_16615 [Erwinia sp. OLSSP12]PIJ78815.1 hypothetical protein BLD47_16585 [Erwinia sp. OLCASP19]PIJ79974.1 hypothetical protein BLD46_16265 [Erwinia sp. OLMTSP26]PIJ80651.1 hypothetical protein BLD49_17025 [Erwinia sp. OLMDSP33]PIJ89195.1 hypothetical protein BL250_16060 [Erwinia sp. OLTSP20]PIJ92656.1 hypothetical protein BL249_06065 [Erwinia sp. OLFS4]